MKHGSGEPKADPAAPADIEQGAIPAATLSGLKWREVGPYRGGRADAVTGVPGDRLTYYFGATGGGVWKSSDAGKSWKPVSDGFFGGSIGDVAVSAWDPNVVYAGTGEVTVRGNVSEGDGLWKSTDAGKTWQHMGLADSRHIARLRIHPKDPNLVYAAVLGHLFGPNPMRGVYRSRDGGTTWQRVLDAGEDVGAFDLAMDPSNPRVLYATTWRVRRTPSSLESGGAGCGLWKSSDGGDTWTDLSRNPGLPKGTLGVIGVAVAPTDPQSVYAVVEAAAGGVFHSRDGGKSWMRTSDDHELRQRAWYYSRIYVDPSDAESVWVVNVQLQHSKDGGKTWRRVATPHGDNHDLWIAPENPLRMIEANDGGVNVSEDGGATWTTQNNQPTAQIYRVATDNAFPYRLYGAQQDNSALRIASRAEGRGIGQRDWEETAGGESGTILPDPNDPDVVYGGSYGGLLIRLNHRTREVRDVNPWPDNPMGWGAAELKYRFQWNFPILFSRDGKRLYVGANVLFKSTDGGQSWQAISPDLTRNDKSKQGPSGGPITKDNTSVEYYDTIFALAESPLDPQVLWVGSDDGLVHVTRDGGGTWKNATPSGLPEWAQVNSLEADPFEKGGAYVAATRYKLDDRRPFLFHTADYGVSWTRIDEGIAREHFTRVVRAHPGCRGLLFAGTQRGVYASFDGGRHWQPFQLNLPLVPVTDLSIKDGDLIAATEGRGFWALDDLSPLCELAGDPHRLSGEPVHLFAPREAYRLSSDGPPGPAPGMGENPPTGVVIDYLLASAPRPLPPPAHQDRTPRPATSPATAPTSGSASAATQTSPARQAAGEPDLKVEILDGRGKLIRAFKGKRKPAEGRDAPISATPPTPGAAKHGGAPESDAAKHGGAPGSDAALPEEVKSEEEPAGPGEQEEPAEREESGRRRGAGQDTAPAEPGLNRFVWNLRHPAAKIFPGMVLWTGEPEGPLAAPGRYQVRLTVEGKTYTAAFEVRKDPRSQAIQEDLEAQQDFLLGIRDKLTETHDALRRLRVLRSQLAELKRRLHAAEPEPADGSGEEAQPAGGVSPTSPSQDASGPFAEAVKAGDALDGKLKAVEEALYQTRNRSSEDPLNFPIRLDDKLNGVAASAAVGDARPSRQDTEVRDLLVAQIDRELGRLAEILRQDLPAFNDRARAAGVGALILPASRLK